MTSTRSRRLLTRSTDSGTITSWVSPPFHDARQPMFRCSGTLATMAPGLP